MRIALETSWPTKSELLIKLACSRRTSVRLGQGASIVLLAADEFQNKDTELTIQSKPEATTNWSTRAMAARIGVSAASVSGHWLPTPAGNHPIKASRLAKPAAD